MKTPLFEGVVNKPNYSFLLKRVKGEEDKKLFTQNLEKSCTAFMAPNRSIHSSKHSRAGNFSAADYNSYRSAHN